MAKATDDRRSEELSGLDIDRRRSDARRDGQRRPWLGRAYEEIYISSYVNAVYPQYPSRVHAFSNLEGEAELSAAEWVVANLGISDATGPLPMRTLSAFASELIKKGLVVDEAGKAVMAQKSVEKEMIEHYLLKTGS